MALRLRQPSRPTGMGYQRRSSGRKFKPTFIVFCGRFCSSDNSSVRSTSPSRFLFEVHGAGREESSVKTILSRITIGPSEGSENEIQGELLEVGVGATTELWVVAVRDGRNSPEDALEFSWVDVDAILASLDLDCG